MSVWLGLLGGLWTIHNHRQLLYDAERTLKTHNLATAEEKTAARLDVPPLHPVRCAIVDGSAKTSNAPRRSSHTAPHVTRKQLEALAELLEPLYLERLDVRIRESRDVEGAIEVLALDRSGRDYVRIMRNGLATRPNGPFVRFPDAR